MKKGEMKILQNLREASTKVIVEFKGSDCACYVSAGTTLKRAKCKCCGKTKNNVDVIIMNGIYKEIKACSGAIIYAGSAEFEKISKKAASALKKESRGICPICIMVKA